jgi:hypothetical protein
MKNFFTVRPSQLAATDEPVSSIYIETSSGDVFTEIGTGIQPVPMMMPEVAGIFVGGCVERGVGSKLNPNKIALAHAHIGTEASRGWICYRSPQIFQNPQYAYVLWHEYAHIMSNEGHTQMWRQVMYQLGQAAEADRYFERHTKLCLPKAGT